MSTTWPVYLVGHDYSHMKFRKFNQSNLQQPSTTVFDDDDTTNFNRLMVYLLFRTNIRMRNTSFGRIFVWVNTSFPRSTFPTAFSRSRFSFGKLSRHCNIDSIILTCSVTNGNYWHRIVRFSMREVLSFFDIHFSSNRIHNKKDLTYIILDLFLSKQKTDVSI